jgi:hypothetical protein
MTKRTDAEFDLIIHSDETHITLLESDDAKQLRADLEPAHAAETGEMPAQFVG